MFKTKTLVAVVAAAAMVMGLSACEKKGPAERAGEKIDNAVSHAGNEIEAAGNKVRRAAN